jgi:hypothetical protein
MPESSRYTVNSSHENLRTVFTITNKNKQPAGLQFNAQKYDNIQQFLHDININDMFQYELTLN